MLWFSVVSRSGHAKKRKISHPTHDASCSVISVSITPQSDLNLSEARQLLQEQRESELEKKELFLHEEINKVEREKERRKRERRRRNVKMEREMLGTSLVL
jgi:hypothetical protein